MINKASLDLIKASEGFVNHWYPDPGTGGQPMTCCYGHTDAAGLPHFKAGQMFTEAEGEAILQRDLITTEATVNALVKVPLNENEFGALVSLVFNIGGGNFATSTLLRLLNAGDRAGAAAQFSRWDLAAGKVLPGLVARRASEARLFVRPVGSPVPAYPIPSPTPPQTTKPPPTGLLSSLWGHIVYFFTH